MIPKYIQIDEEQAASYKLIIENLDPKLIARLEVYSAYLLRRGIEEGKKIHSDA